jgi:hypothetical protein
MEIILAVYCPLIILIHPGIESRGKGPYSPKTENLFMGWKVLT